MRCPVPVDTHQLATIRIVVQAISRGPRSVRQTSGETLIDGSPNPYADAACIAGVSGWASDTLNEARILSSFRQSSSRPRSTSYGRAPGPVGEPLPRVRLGHQGRVSSVCQITISNPTKGATARSTTHRAGGPAGGRTPPGRGDLPKPVHEKARSLRPTLPNLPPAQLTPPAIASPCS